MNTIEEDTIQKTCKTYYGNISQAQMFFMETNVSFLLVSTIVVMSLTEWYMPTRSNLFFCLTWGIFASHIAALNAQLFRTKKRKGILNGGEISLVILTTLLAVVASLILPAIVIYAVIHAKQIYVFVFAAALLTLSYGVGASISLLKVISDTKTEINLSDEEI